MLTARSVWDVLRRQAGDGPLGLAIVCTACTVPPVSAACLTAMSEPLVRELLCATNMLGERLDELVEQAKGVLAERHVMPAAPRWHSGGAPHPAPSPVDTGSGG